VPRRPVNACGVASSGGEEHGARSESECVVTCSTPALSSRRHRLRALPSTAAVRTPGALPPRQRASP